MIIFISVIKTIISHLNLAYWQTNKPHDMSWLKNYLRHYKQRYGYYSVETNESVTS